MKATCSCIVKSKPYCSSFFEDQTLFEQTQTYDNPNTQAVYIALSERISQWEKKCTPIYQEHRRSTLTIALCIDENQHYTFQDFSSCYRFLSDKTGYISLPSIRSRSRSPSQ